MVRGLTAHYNDVSERAKLLKVPLEVHLGRVERDTADEKLPVELGWRDQDQLQGRDRLASADAFRVLTVLMEQKKTSWPISKSQERSKRPRGGASGQRSYPAVLPVLGPGPTCIAGGSCLLGSSGGAECSAGLLTTGAAPPPSAASPAGSTGSGSSESAAAGFSSSFSPCSGERSKPSDEAFDAGISGSSVSARRAQKVPQQRSLKSVPRHGRQSPR